MRPDLNKVVLPYFDGVCTAGILPVLPNPDRLDAAYLHAALMSPQFVQWASDSVSGANLPRLDPTRIAEYRLPLPALDEQQTIGVSIRKINHLRRTRRYAQHLNDTFLQSVFLEMFGDQERNRMGFPIDTLGEYVQAFEGGINFNPVSEGQAASAWKVLKISAFTSGVFDPQEAKPISPSSQFDSTIIVKNNDLLISRANTTELVGAVCMVREVPPPIILPDKLWRIHFREDSQLLPNYALYALRQPHLRKIIGDLAAGSSGRRNICSKHCCIGRFGEPTPSQVTTLPKWEGEEFWAKRLGR